MRAGLLVILLGAFLLGEAPAVFAHGDHGDAAPPRGGVTMVTVGGFQVELLTNPAPPRVGQETKIVAKILENDSLRPARGGRVFMAVAPLSLMDDPATGVKRHSPLASLSLDGSFQQVPEIIWAGSYTLFHRPLDKGPYLVRVALAEMGSTRFDPPAVVEFHLDVAPAGGLSLSLALLVLGTVAMGAGGIYAISIRSRRGRLPGEAFNLLDLPLVGGIIRGRGIQITLQVLFVGLMVLLAFLGFVDVQAGGRNLATKLTWTIWWAGIIFTFVLVGRFWCYMCPFGALNEWGERLAGPHRQLPRAFRNLWWATGMFVLLTLADEQLGVVRSPRVTAWIIVFFALLALFVGLAFERRSFCRYLCPIGGVIGIYSMVSPVELRIRDGQICRAHPTKECYRGGEGVRGCPMFEYPVAMDRNTYCNLCGECVRACSKSNLVLRLRPFGKDLWASGKRALDESYLAMALVGITMVVTAAMLSPWSSWITALTRLIPPNIRQHLKPITYLSLTEAGVLLGIGLVVVPLLVLAAAWVSNRLAGESGRGVRRTLVTFGYIFIPVGLAMHLAHNLSHLLLEGGGVVPAIQQTVLRYTPFSLGIPDWQVAPLVSPDVIPWLQVGLLLGAFVLSLVAGYKLAVHFYGQGEVAGRAVIPVATLSLFFTLINVVLMTLPMASRHGP